MTREDVGKIVSRSFSVWMLTIALRELAMIPRYVTVSHGMAAAIPGQATNNLESALLGEAIVCAAGYVMIGTLLWTKPNLLFRGGPEPIPESTALNITQIRSIVFTAVGIYLSAVSFSSIMQALIARRQFAYLVSIMPNREAYQWIEPAVQLAVGLALVVSFSFGDRLKAILGSRRN